MKLGDTVRDSVTSFEGVAVAKIEWFKGTTAYVVQAKTLNNEGKIVQHEFEEGRLEVVSAKAARGKAA